MFSSFQTLYGPFLRPANHRFGASIPRLCQDIQSLYRHDELYLRVCLVLVNSAITICIWSSLKHTPNKL